MICGLTAAIIAVMANISWRIKHAATHGVGTEYSRATKIAHMVSTSIYYSTASLLHVCSFAREKMCWWLALAKKNMSWWIPSFGDSYHGDAFQYAKPNIF
jgi:hypothetical protein